MSAMSATIQQCVVGPLFRFPFEGKAGMGMGLAVAAWKPMSTQAAARRSATGVRSARKAVPCKQAVPTSMKGSA